MDLKKLGVSAAVLATTLGTVGMSGVQVFAASAAPEADVSYNFVKATPDDPATPTATIVVQPSIKFTDSSKNIDASVVLKSDDGTSAYVGANTYTVGVKSQNAFKLQSENGAGVDDVTYQLTNGAGTVLNADAQEQSLGELTQTASKLNSKATMTGTAKSEGNHTDKLIYSFAKK